MSDKKPLPAAIGFMNTGELPPLEMNWLHIMQICNQALTQELDYVILPVEEKQDYKPQRRRLVKSDKASPKGLIQRDRYACERYYPYASARFEPTELANYAAAQFNAATPADIERLADDVIRGANG